MPAPCLVPAPPRSPGRRAARACAPALALALLAIPAGATDGTPPDQGVHTYLYDGSFGDAIFALEDAIISRGLKVDHVSHVGEMLARTGADLGAEVTIFENADIYLFCSATLSREMMEADPMNIAHCPYSLFVTEIGGEVRIGYRDYPPGAMQKVEAFLDQIAAEAAAF